LGNVGFIPKVIKESSLEQKSKHCFKFAVKRLLLVIDIFPVVESILKSVPAYGCPFYKYRAKLSPQFGVFAVILFPEIIYTGILEL
jgi:hypothetical protein